MGLVIERFRKEYIDDPNLRERLERIKQGQNGQRHSLPVILAGELVKVASAELPRRTGYGAGAMLVPNLSFTFQDVMGGAEARAAIVFGVTLKSLERDILGQSFFNPINWHDDYNVAVRGTVESEMQPLQPEREVYTLSREEWSRMVNCVKDDKTFVAFFREGRDNLPPPLRNILERSQVSSRIDNDIIPVYILGAQLLVTR